MVSCSGVNCGNDKSRCPGSISFHLFPKDKERRAAWIRNCGRPGFEPSKASFICSQHFSQDSYEAEAAHRQRRDLKRDAVPTLFDLPAHLRPKRPKRPRVKREPVDQQNEDPLALPETQPSETPEDSKDQPNVSNILAMAALNDHGYSLPKASTIIERRERMILALSQKSHLVHSLQKTKSKKKVKILKMCKIIADLKKSARLFSNWTGHPNTM